MLLSVRCVLFHFFHAIVKFCVVFVVGIIKRAIPVNYGRTSTEITKLHTTPIWSIKPESLAIKTDFVLDLCLVFFFVLFFFFHELCVKKCWKDLWNSLHFLAGIDFFQGSPTHEEYRIVPRFYQQSRWHQLHYLADQDFRKRMMYAFKDPKGYQRVAKSACSELLVRKTLFEIFYASFKNVPNEFLLLSDLFWLWFFGLLSSSLLFIETQRFGLYIFRTSSGVPCLSGHRNDSTEEIIFKKFDCWSNKTFKKYEDVIQIMTTLIFPPINPRNITRSFSKRAMRWIQNVKHNGFSYSWYF